MSLIVKSGDSTDTLHVNTDKEAQVALTSVATKAGFVKILSSDGSDIDTTENNALRTSAVAMVLYDQVEGAAVNTNVWNPYDVSTQTISQASGFIKLNAGAVTTANAYSNLKSNKVIPLYGSIPLLLEVTANVLNLPQANAICRLGVGTVSAGSAPSDGAFFYWDAAAGFYCAINNGGVQTATGNLSTLVFTDNNGDSITLPPSAVSNHLFAIQVVEDHVQFTIDDIQVADIMVPAGQAFPFNAGRQQIFAQVVNSGTPPSLAPQLSIGQVTGKYEDLQQNRSWPEFMAIIGRGGYQSPVTPFGQTANFANSTNPTSATLSNTAAGYTTPDGDFQFVATAGAVTDYALFAYQVPAGFQRIIYGISISCVSMGALGSAITPTILRWGLGVNSSAVSLATADGTNTWAPRRKALGMQTFALTTAIGAQAQDISRTFIVPLVVESGRFLHIIVQIPVGVATASQVFRGTVTLNSYDE